MRFLGAVAASSWWEFQCLYFQSTPLFRKNLARDTVALLADFVAPTQPIADRRVPLSAPGGAAQPASAPVREAEGL